MNQEKCFMKNIKLFSHREMISSVIDHRGQSGERHAEFCTRDDVGLCPGDRRGAFGGDGVGAFGRSGALVRYPRTAGGVLKILPVPVCMVCESDSDVFQRVSGIDKSSFSKRLRSGFCDIAAITVSNASIKNSPVGFGLRRPDASGSPNAIRSNRIAFTRPFSSAKIEVAPFIENANNLTSAARRLNHHLAETIFPSEDNI